MKQNSISFLTVVIGSFILCQGCGSGIRGAGADAQAQYAWGKLKAQLHFPVETTYQASMKAAEELELSVFRDEHDEVAGLITARDAQDDTIKIKLEALPQSMTAMSIQVGTFGDKNKSNVIFNQIVKNLRQEG